MLCTTNNSIKHHSFVYTQLNDQTVLVLTIHFWISSIWPIDRTLSDAISPGQSGPGSDGNERVLCILQRSSITGVSLSDFFMSYPGHSFGGSYPSAVIHLAYSTAPNTWAFYLWAVTLGNFTIYKNVNTNILKLNFI